MQIGICDIREAWQHNEHLLREFAPQWSVLHIAEWHEDARQSCIDDAHRAWEEWGVRSVVDLRTKEEGGGLAVRHDWWRGVVTDLVERLTPLVQHWQFWSEAHCPYVGKGWTWAGYVEDLAVTAEVIREVNPEAKILLGGHAEQFKTAWYEGVMGEGAARLFDWNALHPYFPSPRNWPEIETAANAAFDKFAELCGLAGVEEHPVCVTEFGVATHPGWDDADDSEDLKSWVYPSVRTLSQAHVAEYVDLLFQFLEMRGVEFVLWMYWQDWEDAVGHWSTRAGLLNKEGAPKSPLYEVLCEWSQRGRRSAPSSSSATLTA